MIGTGSERDVAGGWDPHYLLGEHDAVALYRMRPRPGAEPHEAAAELAAAVTPPFPGADRAAGGARAWRIERLNHRARQYLAWVACDTRALEPGSIAGAPPGLTAGVAGHRARALDAARLEDLQLPPAYVRSFPGPGTGIAAERARLGKFRRPLLAAVARPAAQLDARHYARAIYQGLSGGLDFVHLEEDPHAPRPLPWRERFLYTMDAVCKASVASGEVKASYLDVTAATLESMYERAALARELGAAVVRVDGAVGWSAIQSLCGWARSYGLVVHLQGAAHLGVTRHRNRGISLRVIAKWLRLAGVDHLQGGSHSSASPDGHERVCRDTYTRADSTRGLYFDQDWCGLRRVLPVAAAGVHPHRLHELLGFYGDDVVLELNGAALRHPAGLKGAAIANREALEAMVLARDEGCDLGTASAEVLKAAARLCRPLQQALNYWEPRGATPGTPLELLAVTH